MYVQENFIYCDFFKIGERLTENKMKRNEKRIKYVLENE